MENVVFASIHQVQISNKTVHGKIKKNLKTGRQVQPHSFIQILFPCTDRWYSSVCFRQHLILYDLF